MSFRLLTLLVRGVDRALLAVAAIGLLAMMVHISADIVGSLLFRAPIAVTSVIVTQYYMIAVAFLPIFSTELRGGHIGITMLTDHLPQRIRRALDILVMALIAIIYAMLALQAWEQAQSKLAVGAFVVEQTSRIIVWPSFFIVPVAFGAVALLMVMKVTLSIAGHPHPTPDPDADADAQDDAGGARNV